MIGKMAILEFYKKGCKGSSATPAIRRLIKREVYLSQPIREELSGLEYILEFCVGNNSRQTSVTMETRKMSS